MMSDAPMSSREHTLTITADGESSVSEEVVRDRAHTLSVEVDRDNGDIYLEFSTRQAMYDFARSLLHAAVFGDGVQKEIYPLIADGKELVVNGARLTEGSSRMFINYPSSPRRDS